MIYLGLGSSFLFLGFRVVRVSEHLYSLGCIRTLLD